MVNKHGLDECAANSSNYFGLSLSILRSLCRRGVVWEQLPKLRQDMGMYILAELCNFHISWPSKLRPTLGVWTKGSGLCIVLSPAEARCR